MSSFTNHPSLLPLLNGIQWCVMEDFEYHVGSEDSGEVVKVPKDFITDGASIPRFAWSIIGGPWGKYGYSAIVHDYLYFTKQFSRKKSDYIFYEAMGVLKVSQWKRWIMWKAVRLFAGYIWKKREKQLFD